MSRDEFMDIPVRVDQETARKLARMTKKEMIDRMCSLAVELEVYKQRCKVAVEDADKAAEESERLRKEIESMQTKLDKSEAYVEQGRAMIEAVMERWYEYDV